MGDEDHYGDMDFKVAGTEKGITALQMDIKIGGRHRRHHAPGARPGPRGAAAHPRARCAEAIKGPRAELSPNAPRFVTIKIRPEKIGEIIGPGGKVIRGIQEETGAKIDIEDDGKVTVFSPSSEAAQMAIGMIQDICREAELDRIYLGKVKNDQGVRRLRGDHPRHRGAAPHLPDRREPHPRGGRRALRGRHRAVKVIEIDGNGKMRLSPQGGAARPARRSPSKERLEDRARRGEPPRA